MPIPMLPRLLLATIAASLLVPAPAAASSPEMFGLERALSMLVAGRTGEYGIAALDLRDGSIVAVNGETPFPMASTVKLAIAAAYLAEVDRGRRSLSDTISGRSAARVMDLMIVRSDNIAARSDARRDRWPCGRPAMAVLARADRHPGRPHHRAVVARTRPPRRQPRRRHAVAMVALLNKLSSGTVLSAPSRTFLLDLMGRCATGTRRIRALLPAGTVVEDKTGTLDGVTNDVGFITMPDGHRVAVALFARGGRDRQPGIAEAARMIYDHFADGTRSALSYFMRLR